MLRTVRRKAISLVGLIALLGSVVVATTLTTRAAAVAAPLPVTPTSLNKAGAIASSTGNSCPSRWQVVISIRLFSTGPSPVARK